MKRFSPTTALSYLRLVVVATLVGHILFKMCMMGVYFIDERMGLAYVALYLVIDKLFGVAESHFTADSSTLPKV